MTPIEQDALKPFSTLLDALSARDGERIRSLLVFEGSATIFRNGKFLNMTLAKLGDRLCQIVSEPDHLVEVMPDPLVKVDGNIALIWGEYLVTRNGKPDHCGCNLVSVVYENAKWVIASITDTSRVCD